MKIIGKTLEGDLIISVSQAEWDGLGDGVRPKDDDDWENFITNRYGTFYFDRSAWGALHDMIGHISIRTYNLIKRYYQVERNGTCTLDTLKRIADGKITIHQFGDKARRELKEALGTIGLIKQ